MGTSADKHAARREAKLEAIEAAKEDGTLRVSKLSEEEMAAHKERQANRPEQPKKRRRSY